MRDVDDEVIADIYEETAPLSFTRQTVKVPIFEYSIICDVSVQVVAQAGAKKGRNAPQPQVKITKVQANKVTRQMENAGKYSTKVSIDPDVPDSLKISPLFRHSHFCLFVPATSVTI